MIVVVGDIHAKTKQPYRKYIGEFFEWLLENYKNEIIIQLGDLFDSSSPHNDVRDEIVCYIKQFKEFHVFDGNHDYYKTKGSALKPLRNHSNIFVYDKPTEVTIEGMKCLLLPFRYSKMKEEYEALTGSYDYIFTHVTPVECQFVEEGIQLNLDGIYIHGHTHIQVDFNDKNDRQHYVLGVPLPTRHLEDKQSHRIMGIESKDNYSFIDVPFYFKYETLQYGEFPESKNNILNIEKAPSIQSVYEKYKDYYIRPDGIQLSLELEGVEYTIDFEEDTLEKQFMEFAKDNNINEDITNKSVEYIQTIV